ncbi:hypothetical protein L195_g052660 [Trifolium pratense]|uniref:Uncharacterized protein n=1 Tax=Trifolium pratense TaxID=57577 RepID=A0A2K3K6C8_TRIPR|nr:hypothetical protein L195_g052660 [Trifolium pratense]
MAEAHPIESSTSSNEKEMSESEIEVANQLIQLSSCKRKNMMTLEEELEVDDEAIAKMKPQPKNHQKKKKKYRSLVDIYKTTTPI